MKFLVRIFISFVLGLMPAQLFLIRLGFSATPEDIYYPVLITSIVPIWITSGFYYRPVSKVILIEALILANAMFSSTLPLNGNIPLVGFYGLNVAILIFALFLRGKDLSELLLKGISKTKNGIKGATQKDTLENKFKTAYLEKAKSELTDKYRDSLKPKLLEELSKEDFFDFIAEAQELGSNGANENELNSRIKMEIKRIFNESPFLFRDFDVCSPHSSHFNVGDISGYKLLETYTSLKHLPTQSDELAKLYKNDLIEVYTDFVIKAEKFTVEA